MKRVINFILAVILVYAGFVALLFFFQRSLQYHPMAADLDPKRFNLPEMSVVEIATDDGLKLKSWYKAAENGLPTILFLHGNAGHIGFRAGKAKPIIEAGYGMFLLSYRGFGSNPGKPTEQNLYLDAQAALAYLKEQNVPLHKTVIYGESLGTGVGVDVAQHLDLAAVILESPFSSMADAARHHYPIMPVNRLLKDRYESIEKIKNLRSPLLIIHGENDRIVPFELGKRLFEAANEPKRFLPVKYAGHNDLYDHGVLPHIISFLENPPEFSSK